MFIYLYISDKRDPFQPLPNPPWKISSTNEKVGLLFECCAGRLTWDLPFGIQETETSQEPCFPFLH